MSEVTNVQESTEQARGGGDDLLRAAREGKLTMEDLEQVTGGDGGDGSAPWYVHDSSWNGGPENNPFNYTDQWNAGADSPTYMGPGWGAANYDPNNDFLKAESKQ
ncbi:MAG: hypothetical protein F4Y76_05510 [Acidimicrobiales bacterium]|nr:hypothetical protein [Acidimicrobiaceae bacterium]MDE0676014.1 hypothetical protein [Acidimicrobiaceae bacterium]MXZ14961.1 hypothetical protein [Acidimicrobiales bacterium]MYG62842.1 hypothetical protein [Acidimicrobiales bacterium]